MNQSQFDALTELAGLRSEKTRVAVRLMLIDGVGPTEAARRTGMSQPAASQAVGRVRRCLDLAKRALDL